MFKLFSSKKKKVSRSDRRRLHFEPLETRTLLSITAIYVAPAPYGSDSSGNGSNSAPFLTISHAAIAARKPRPAPRFTFTPGRITRQ